MRGKFAYLILFAFTFGACKSQQVIPLESPEPEPTAAATPATKLEYKRDAELEKVFAKVAEEAKGKVGVAAVVLETGEAAFLNAEDRYPMQSVYKLPISMAVMEQVRVGKLDLDEQVGVTKEDFVRPGMASSLRDKNPNGGEFTIRELIRLALVESDGTASDVLLRVLGGASEVQSYLTQIGITDMKVINTEKEIGKDWQTQYENWSTPMASVELLRWLDTSIESVKAEGKKDSERGIVFISAYDWVRGVMAVSVPGEKRLKGLLPKGRWVAHKTGTGGTQNGITGATNDIGIVSLPNDNHLAIAVFVSESPADEKTREAVIAKIAKAAWDRWVNQ